MQFDVVLSTGGSAALGRELASEMSDGDGDDIAERARARLGVVLRGKYRIERLLGVGGMAAVYAASHRNGKQVAVKLLHPELSIRADIRKRFIREAQAANAIHHPGVVGIIDDDVTEEGATFLVMELLSGRSVEDLWIQSGGRLSAATVLAIGRELCAVLVATHAAGIVHRDIKPANLFVTDDARLKVLDFGIARVRDFATTNLTDTGMLLGTPAFMAPEQAQGRVSEIDERTDVWAIGATMFTLFSGRVVHEGETAQHMTILAATQPARSLAAVAPEAPQELVEIVDRALALSKSDRWPSAKTLLRAILDVSERLFGDAHVPLDCDALAATRERPSGAPKTTEIDLVPYYRVRVGKTTSSPVSSSAPTEPRRKMRAWANTLRMGPITRTLISAFRSVRAVVRRESRSAAIVQVGGDAADRQMAIPNDDARLLPRRRSRPPPPSRVPLAVMIVAGASLAVGVAAVVGSSNLFAKRRDGNERKVETGAPPPPVAMSAAVAAPTAPAPASAVSTTAAPTPPVISLDDETPPRTAPMRPKGNARPAARSAPSLPPKASPSSSTRPDCNPNYFIDEAGNKVFKKECPL